jgi:hypothetical protein
MLSQVKRPVHRMDLWPHGTEDGGAEHKNVVKNKCTVTVIQNYIILRRGKEKWGRNFAVGLQVAITLSLGLHFMDGTKLYIGTPTAAHIKCIQPLLNKNLFHTVTVSSREPGIA